MSKVVLMYHDIVAANNRSSGFQNPSALQYKVDENDFELHVMSCTPDKVIFSFDDGGSSFFTKAIPILEKYGHKGIFFISTNYIDTPGFLTADQIKCIEDKGHIVGSHSCSHPHNMTELSEDEISNEWVYSINKLEKILGHKIEYASIPNGYSSLAVINRAKEAGIKYLYTSSPIDSIRDKGGMKLIGRYVVHNKMLLNDVVAIVDSSLCRRVKYFKWISLEIVKKMLGNRYDNLKSLITSKFKK